MATLYGTLATGEVLPVQVNNKGQLMAEGLPGPEGPQGTCRVGTNYVSYNKPPGDLGVDGDWWIQVEYDES